VYSAIRRFKVWRPTRNPPLPKLPMALHPDADVADNREVTGFERPAAVID
jgi:hypothetical protein